MKKLIISFCSLLFSMLFIACSNEPTILDNNEVYKVSISDSEISDLDITLPVDNELEVQKMSAEEFVNYCTYLLHAGEVVYDENLGYHSFMFQNINNKVQNFDYSISLTPMSDEDLKNEIKYFESTSLGTSNSIYYLHKKDNIWGMYSYDTPGEIIGYIFIYGNVLIKCTDFGSSSEAVYELVDTYFHDFNSIVDYEGLEYTPKG